MAKRDRTEILVAVIEAIGTAAPAGEPGPVRLTHVQARANVPFDRLKEYLEELRGRGLVEADPWRATARGLEFAAEYRRFQRMLDRFGFGPGAAQK